ncbi:MAG TPA: hypothetical protein VIU38_05305 [Anaerolineales bacterium]
MTLPSFLLGLICALLIGTIFHFAVDGGLGRLLLYLALSCAGFAAGQGLAVWQGWIFLPLGPLQMGPAVLGSVMLLLLGNWLGQINIERTDGDGRV